MKRFYMSTVSAAMALALMSAPLAMAQPAPNHEDTHGGPPPAHAMNQPAPMQHMSMQHTTAPAHEAQPRDNNQPHVAAVQHDNYTHVTQVQNTHVTVEQHAVYHGHPMPPAQFSGHYWHHGDHYDGQRNYVSNWQYYGLQQPPSGYEWVQDGSQFVLVAVASGIIADVILGALSQ